MSRGERVVYEGPGMRRGLASGLSSQGVGWGYRRRLCCGSGVQGRLQTAVPHLYEAAEGARDQQLLKLWQMLYWAADEGLELGNVLGPISANFSWLPFL